MKNEQHSLFQSLINARLTALSENSEQTRAARAPVELDQQSVGRLSRMDALQQQALNSANETRRQTEIAQLQAALDRIASGEFGYCEDCGDDIPFKRLELLPTTRFCVGCASG